jgi:hypothetical protein
MQKTKKINRLAYLIPVVVLALAVSLVWVISGRLDQARINFLKVVPVPIAFVGGEPIFVKDFLQAKSIAPSNVTDANVYAAVIQNKKLEIIAGKNNIKSPNNKDTVIKVHELNNAIRQFYNSQKTLNSEVYDKAEGIIIRVRQGEDFGSLAKNYSQDEFSKKLGGETGTVKVTELLPPIAQKIKAMQAGQTELVVSPLGLHIIQLVSLNTDEASLKQIFLDLPGYDAWLMSNLSEIKTKSIIKP